MNIRRASGIETGSAEIPETASEGGLLPRLILASSSPRRLQLLAQAGLRPDAVVAAEIDEAPRRDELPRDLARRLAREKAEAALQVSRERCFLLAADTVVSVGRRILPKAETVEEAERCLALLSGRAHRVHTAVCLIAPGAKRRERLVETRVRFKRLSGAEIGAYLASGEWRGKAGAYAIQGLAGSFALGIVGSYTGIVGLPLYETICLLEGEGFPVRHGWADKVPVEPRPAEAA
jgi:septum formation protein